MPTAEPHLLLDGTELVSSLRTLTYLRRGLGGGRFEAHLVSPLTPEVGYRDEYLDAYEADPFWPGNLLCFCDLLDAGPYVSPAADPAPWYDVTRPESGGFLGVIANVVVPSVARRAVTPRSSGGGDVGPLRLGPRLVQVSGVMYGTSPAAMAWGEAWLRQHLAGAQVGCGEGSATILPACPPEDAATPDDYLRELADVGLADGPVFEPIADVGSCYAQNVSFQLAAGQPHLRHPAIPALATTYLRSTPTACCTVEGPATVGDAAARITIHAGQIGSTVRGIDITAVRDASCPSARPAEVTYHVDRIPRGCALVIDSSRRRVSVTNTLTGEVVAGPDALGITGLIPWVVAGPGEEYCICIDATRATLNAGTLAVVEAVGREI